MLLAVFVAACSAGADARQALAYVAFLVGHVVLPGLVLRASTRSFEGGACTSAFGAWILGAAFQCAGFFATRALGCPALAPWLPLPLLALLVRPHVRRGLFAASTRLSPAELLVGLVFLALLLVRNLGFAPDAWGAPPESDPPFHAGNAAELLHGWPMCDPRVAATPLRYHVLAYGLAAGASQVTGIAVWSTSHVLGNLVAPLLLVLGLLALGERCLGSRAAGLAAAALLVLHEDLFAMLGHLAGPDLSSHSFLGFGVHSSPSSALSLAFLAAILLLLEEWTEAERPRLAQAVLLLCWGAVESGTKGSAMPVLLAGLALAGSWQLVRERRFPGRLALAGLLLALGALPYSLWLVAGPDDYASAMLRWAPLATIRDTPLSQWIAAHAGSAGSALAICAWPLGYLGLALVGALGRLFERGRAGSDTERRLACVALAGLAAALLWFAPGQSQLFFAYGGQLALTCLAGGWIVRRAPWLQAALALLLLAAAVPSTRAQLEQRAAQRFVPSALDLAHRAGDEWMRRELPPDAVLVVEVPGFLHSVHAEREVLLETEKYLPRTLARESGARPAQPADAGDPLALRTKLQGRCLERPTRENWRRLRELVGAERPLFAVRERAQGPGTGPLHAAARPPAGSPLFEPLFENEALGVYRLREP